MTSVRTDGVARLRAAIRFGLGLLQRRLLRLLLLFVGLLLPLWGFAELADEVYQREALAFDEPILRFAHQLAHDGLNRMFLFFSAIGYAYGVVPVDMILICILIWLRRSREVVFAGIAILGSAMLNLTTKQVFARDRPRLWESLSPETTYSFPSGHAMGSATLAWVVLLLVWHTRWRSPVAAVAMFFVVMVGFSRVYLGVHYPSDILAGWTAASAWVVSSYVLVYRTDMRPWRNR